MSTTPADKQWKNGNEFAPFHPQASHIPPDYRDGWNHCYQAALAAVPAQVATVGWKLVPVEPTPEMVDAGCPAGEVVDHYDMATAYSAMLAAAPAPVAPAEVEPEPDPITKYYRDKSSSGSPPPFRR